ncbi:hypothetical protein ALC57_09929, partial [Trachymyrmex cornetzi]
VTAKGRDLSQKGLSVEQREELLKKYTPSEEVAFLRSSIDRIELKSVFKKITLIKRDAFNSRLSLSRQVQLMPALNLLAMSTTDAVPSDIYLLVRLLVRKYRKPR